jgi:hypothetical protein
MTDREEHELGAFHGLEHKGNLGARLVASTHHRVGVRMATNHGRPAIFADCAPAPPVASFAASKALSRSVDVTKAHDMTLVGGASLNDGIFLVVAAVDKALKGSMARERMNKSFRREVRGRG